MVSALSSTAVLEYMVLMVGGLTKVQGVYNFYRYYYTVVARPFSAFAEPCSAHHGAHAYSPYNYSTPHKQSTNPRATAVPAAAAQSPTAAPSRQAATSAAAGSSVRCASLQSAGSSGSLGMQSFELGGGDGRQRSWHHGTDVFPGECDGQNIRVHTVGWAAAAASAGSLARKREKESAAAGVAARRVSRIAVQAGTAARKAADARAAAAIVPHEPRRSLEAGAAAARAPDQDELSGSSSERSGSAPPRPEAAAAAAGSSVRFASSAPRYALLPSPSCCFHTAQQLCACGTDGRALCVFASRLWLRLWLWAAAAGCAAAM